MNRMLVIEPRRALQTAIQMALRDVPYEVVMAASEEDALQKLRSGAYDIVLLDLAMPNIEANEILSRLRDIAVSILPVVVASSDEAQRLFEANAGVRKEGAGLSMPLIRTVVMNLENAIKEMNEINARSASHTARAPVLDDTEYDEVRISKSVPEHESEGTMSTWRDRVLLWAADIDHRVLAATIMAPVILAGAVTALAQASPSIGGMTLSEGSINALLVAFLGWVGWMTVTATGTQRKHAVLQKDIEKSFKAVEQSFKAVDEHLIVLTRETTLKIESLTREQTTRIDSIKDVTAAELRAIRESIQAMTMRFHDAQR